MNETKSSHRNKSHTLSPSFWAWDSFQAWDALAGEARLGLQEEGACSSTARTDGGDSPRYPKGTCGHSLREQLYKEEGEHSDSSRMDGHMV